MKIENQIQYSALLDPKEQQFLIHLSSELTETEQKKLAEIIQTKDLNLYQVYQKSLEGLLPTERLSELKSLQELISKLNISQKS